jgi:hypothetical protein
MILDEDHLADVQEVLHETDGKWKALGIQFRIPYAKLAKIEQQYSNLEVCNQQMQITWLKTGEATWTDLVKALRTKSVGLPEVAASIETGMRIHHADSGSMDHHTGCKSSRLLIVSVISAEILWAVPIINIKSGIEHGLKLYAI